MSTQKKPAKRKATALVSRSLRPSALSSTPDSMDSSMSETAQDITAVNDTTPRTLVENFMKSHDTIQSSRKKPRIQLSPVAKAQSHSPQSQSSGNSSVNESPNRSRRRTLNQSVVHKSLRKKATMNNFMVSDNQGPTPRTMIHGFLDAGIEETPVAGSQLRQSTGTHRDLSDTIFLEKSRNNASDFDISNDSFLTGYPSAKGRRKSLRTAKRNRAKAAIDTEAFIEDLDGHHSKNTSSSMIGSSRKKAKPSKSLDLRYNSSLNLLHSKMQGNDSTQFVVMAEIHAVSDEMSSFDIDSSVNASNAEETSTVDMVKNRKEIGIDKSIELPSEGREQEQEDEDEATELQQQGQQETEEEVKDQSEDTGNTLEDVAHGENVAHHEDEVHEDVPHEDVAHHGDVSHEDVAHQEDVSCEDVAHHEDVSHEDVAHHEDVSREDVAHHDDVSREDVAHHDDVSREDVAHHEDVSHEHVAHYEDVSSEDLTPEDRTPDDVAQDVAAHEAVAHDDSVVHDDEAHQENAAFHEDVANDQDVTPNDTEHHGIAQEEHVVVRETEKSDQRENVGETELEHENNSGEDNSQRRQEDNSEVLVNGDVQEQLEESVANVSVQQSVENGVPEPGELDQAEERVHQDVQLEWRHLDRASQVQQSSSHLESIHQPAGNKEAHNDSDAENVLPSLISNNTTSLQTPKLKQLRMTDLLHSPGPMSLLDHLATPGMSKSFAQLARPNKTPAVTKSHKVQPQQEKRPPTTKPATEKGRSKSVPRLPTSLTKSIFQHFCRRKTNKQVMDEVEKVADEFWKNATSDLSAYAAHAHRKGIEQKDVEMLMSRQGFITEKQSLNLLIENYLPLEYREELIPVARSGNVIVPKK